jgi:lipopolysaccharide transport system ATP-binding protein
MIKQTAIEVNKLNKSFIRISTPLRMLMSFMFDFAGRKREEDEFVALKDINFFLEKGEILGIIGVNGSGKSTLLKILAGTLNRSSGDIIVNGSVGAILELGTGFHPEYTGRENIYMGGAVLGMSRGEIDKKIESIIEFSGIRKFIDEPFRTYSSGMKARLTFSLAINQNPDILIIDEALSTGDAIFVEKCLARIREICSKNTTVLFVSHSLEVLQMFCKRGIWLHEGKIIMDDDISLVCKAYQRFIYEQSDFYLKSYSGEGISAVTASDLIRRAFDGEKISLSHDSDFFKYGSKQVVIKKFDIVDINGKSRNLFMSGEYVEIRIYYEGLRPVGTKLMAGCQIFNDKGALIFTPSSSNDSSGEIDPPQKTGVFRFIFKSFILGSGEYTFNPILSLDDGEKEFCLDSHDRTYRIRIESSKYKYSYIVELPVTVECECD